MRATARTLMLLCIAVVGLGWSRTAEGGASPLGAPVWLAVAGQTEAQAATARQESNRLLSAARRAMKAGQLDEAEQLINQASRLNVSYDPLTRKFYYTPEQARAELAKLRRAMPGSAAGAARAAMQRLPAAPQGRGRAFVGGDTAKAQGLTLLLEARRALARSDATTATAKVQQAKSLGAVYGLTEDSPAKVESQIRQFQQFSSGARQLMQTKAYAQFLLAQSEGLLSHRDFDSALRLAQNAKAIPARYQLNERTPDWMIEQIALKRRAEGIPRGGQFAGRGQLAGRQPGPQQSAPRQPAPRQPAMRSAAPAAATHPLKPQAQRMISQARAALDRGDLATAERMMGQVQAMRLPANVFSAAETAPWQIQLQINRAKNLRRFGGVQQAGAVTQAVAGNPPRGRYPVQAGVYDPANDRTQTVPAQAAEQPTPARPPGQPSANAGGRGPSPGQVAYQRGLEALKRQDSAGALKFFDEAWKYQSELDPITRSALRDKLTLLRVAQTPPPTPPARPGFEDVTSQQELVRQKFSREISGEISAAEKMLQSDPISALNRLQKLRRRVSESGLESISQKQLLTTLDPAIKNVEDFIERNSVEIAQRTRNRTIVEEVRREREAKIRMGDKIAELVEEFNKLIDERRYHEAELIAKQVRELDAQSPIAATLIWKSRFIKRIMEQERINEAKEQGFVDAIDSVVESSTPFDDRKPFQFGSRPVWEEMSKRRKRMLDHQRRRWTEEEIEIRKSLTKKIDVRFDNVPLAEVLHQLGDLAGISIHLDKTGLAAEAVASDTPVTISLTKPVSLRSALHLILDPLRLSYVIEHEVLLVTSETARESKVYTEVYNVADLVIPIPNFVPGYNVGLPAAIREAHQAMGYGAAFRPSGQAPLTFASSDVQGRGGASALAQMGQSGILGSQSTRPSQPSGYGAGGMGGAAMADFDTLIDLITTTIAPQTWDEVGGPGAIESFPTNLSLVISQTQEVHEQIADLLEQLRRLQDLQIAIEVRFITLNDDFFERIGVDFDFDIDDNSRLDTLNPFFPDDRGRSLGFGLDPAGQPTSDLDLQFTQDSFGASVPQFGNFDAATAANFGFAILSDIEVFFLIQASQGDERANVLQAPKVTMFNGQSASVSDTSQRPFVTSIIPVVGDFAAAHQPVITVLNEGTSLNVQAVVSSDRRFVRLTLVPFFSQIGAVDTFTFNGSTTTDTGSNALDGAGNPIDAVDNVVTTTEGTTVQLPTFSFTTVSTTVSVPDGGTVLLGGIKRLQEGRTERGVPLLAKLPYINRLFKNVGIGRTTQTLMLMVTPRIIIQEEEEAKLGIDLDN